MKKLMPYLFAVLAACTVLLPGRAEAQLSSVDGSLVYSSTAGVVTNGGGPQPTAAFALPSRATCSDWEIGMAGTTGQSATFNLLGSVITLVVQNTAAHAPSLKGKCAFLKASPSISVTALSAGATAYVLLQGGVAR